MRIDQCRFMRLLSSFLDREIIQEKRQLYFYLNRSQSPKIFVCFTNQKLFDFLLFLSCYLGRWEEKAGFLTPEDDQKKPEDVFVTFNDQLILVKQVDHCRRYSYLPPNVLRETHHTPPQHQSEPGSFLWGLLCLCLQLFRHKTRRTQQYLWSSLFYFVCAQEDDG